MSRKATLTPRQRIAVLNAAIQACSTMHGSVTGESHATEAQLCSCEYGVTIRGLKSMRREAYAAVQEAKEAAHK